jgi:hypothetical protein
MTYPCVLYGRWRTEAGLALLAPLVGLACSPPLDALGVEEVVTEQRARTLEATTSPTSTRRTTPTGPSMKPSTAAPSR